MTITLEALRGYVGKPINDFCNTGYTKPEVNHCAHFVGHVLGLQLGMLCGGMNWKTRKIGASIRCNELYNALALKGKWEDRPAFADGLLVFVISAAQVVQGAMRDFPNKHVGIHFGGQVFNYSNTQDKVVADPSVEAFHSKFKRLYGGNDVSLFYGVAAP
jgi:hypothetical protein